MYKTIEQIHHEYDGHWVFLINCKEGEQMPGILEKQGIPGIRIMVL